MAIKTGGGMVKLEGAEAEKSKSRALFLKFQGKAVYDGEARRAINGDRIVQETIIRFENGYIHGGLDLDGKPQPAIECKDVHTEWWEQGYLHREDGPAVISDFGDWEEYWEHGKLVSIYCRPPDTDWGRG